MAEQQWIRPEMPTEAAGTAWAGRPGAHFELRPLSLGEILDRTFALYRSRFWLFAAISAIAAAVNIVGQAFTMATTSRFIGRGLFPPSGSPGAALANLGAILSLQSRAYVVLLVFFLVASLTQAATALAMKQVYLRDEASAKGALKEVLPAWSRWMGIALWQLGSMLWIPLAAMVPAFFLITVGARNRNYALIGVGAIMFSIGLLGGLSAGIVLYLRNALAIPAAVTEGLSVRKAMQRSKALAKGAKGRIFVVILVAVALLEVVGLLQTPLALLMLAAPQQKHLLAQGIALLISFVGRTVVAPVALIGLTLVYFDQRVRKEAFDLQWMLEDAREGSGGDRFATGMTGNESTEGYAPSP